MPTCRSRWAFVRFACPRLAKNVRGTVAASLESDQPLTHALTPRDLAVLEFERRWTRHAGAKEEAIREVFGLSAARYY